MKRRGVLAGVAVGATAALAGAGWAWRRQQSPLDPADGEGIDQAALAAFWSLSFEQPGGGQLAMASLRGKSLLVNFWATWCPPCIKELPLLDAFHKENAVRGWQVVGLAIDGPTPVRQFLQRKPLGFPVGLAGMEGLELTKVLGNAGGQLPFSVVFDKKGLLRQLKLGTVDEAQLKRWDRDVS